MITIKIFETGDEAEADSPEAAVLAYRTLRQDALGQHPNQGYDVTGAFLVAGKLVRQIQGAL